MTRKIETIQDLQPNPENSNRGTPRGHGIIEHSLRQRGAGRSGLAAADGTMIAGNQTLQKVAELGIPIRPVHTDGKEWIVVIRDDIEPGSEDARLLELEDNRASEVGLSYDPEVLASLRDSMDLSPLFHDDELAALLAGVGGDMTEGEGGDGFDGTPVADGPTRTALGDLWSITGNGLEHRLIVGDCTDPAVVERLMGGERPVLMVTDPPYGVKYDPEWRTVVRGEANTPTSVGAVSNDDQVDWSVAFELGGADVAYVWHASWFIGEVQISLLSVGYETRNLIVWSKNIFSLSRGDYHWAHEPCWYAVKKGATRKWRGDRKQTTVWDVPPLHSYASTDEHTGHGTQKPVELFTRPIRNNTDPNDLVYDPFVGSGTSIVAAHRTGRRCFGCEISPKYADVILRRAEAVGLTCSLAAGLSCTRVEG